MWWKILKTFWFLGWTKKALDAPALVQAFYFNHGVPASHLLCYCWYANQNKSMNCAAHASSPISVTCVLPADTIDVNLLLLFTWWGGGQTMDPKHEWLNLFYSAPHPHQKKRKRTAVTIHPSMPHFRIWHACTYTRYKKKGISQKNISYNSFSLL